jgi:hypothetical protein
MNTKYSILFFSCLLLAMVSVPQQGMAQRFSHPNAGGGGARPAPPQMRAPSPPMRQAPAPQPIRQAPPPSRPVVNPLMRGHEETAQPATINGGSRNFGNHDLSRNNAPNPRENVPVRPAPETRPNPRFHVNVNVYHSHNQPFHAYSYHPYHPYYWGHSWHPVGFFLRSLAADAFLFSLANQQYYYDEGVYYAPASGGGYTAIPAPIGAIVNQLPPGFETLTVGEDYFYYYGGDFYVATQDNRYQVVQAPFGAVVTQIPDGAVEQDINGQSYLVYNNVYYQPISQNGQDAYEVVQVN